MDSRVGFLAISLGISLGILVVFVQYFYGIALAVVLISAEVVVASREDLRTLGEEKIWIFWIVVTAAIVTGGSYLVTASFASSVFDSLVILNFFVIFVYIVMRIRPRIDDRDY